MASKISDISVRLDDILPPPSTTRWVKSRKKAVVEAIRAGLITDKQACERYDLCQEELDSWKSLMKAYGPDALRTTHLTRYRAHDPSDAPSGANPSLDSSERI